MNARLTRLSVCLCHQLPSLVRPHRLKKRVVIAVGLLAGLQLQGQGTVNFSNLGLNAPVYSLSCSNTVVLAAAGTSFTVQLYWSPFDATNPNAPTAPFQPQTPSGHLAVAGIYNLGTVTIPGITPPGGMGWFQVKAWETAFGKTFEQAEAAPAMNGRTALIGASNIIRLWTQNPFVPPDTTPPLLIGISGITLLPSVGPAPCVPEASVLILVFCGAAILPLSASRHRSN